MTKVYPKELLNDLKTIGSALEGLQKSKNIRLRAIAQFSSLSVNSVKSVLMGNTANIASYDMVARSLDISLINLIQSLGTVASTTPPSKTSPEYEITTISNSSNNTASEGSGALNTLDF